MKNLHLIIGILILMLVPGIALAESGDSQTAESSSTAKSGPYIGIKGGYSLISLDKNQIKLRNGGSGHGSRHSSFDLGDEDFENFAAGLTIGYKLQNWPVRIELDGTYRKGGDQFERNGSYTVSGGTPNTYNLNSKIEVKSFSTLMMNLWLDIPLGGLPVTPYVGGGAGVALVEYDTAFSGSSSQGNINQSDNRTEAGFAWCIGAGLGYDVTRNVTLDLGYRYTATEEFDGESDGHGGSGVKYRLALRSHDMTLGLRYTF